MPCNSMERALTQLTSMGGYLAGVIVSAPQDFGYLVAGSFGVVAAACLLYIGWALSPKSVPLRPIGKVVL